MNEFSPGKKYIREAQHLPPSVHPGVVQWNCPSNIALVKYWGKKEEQVPLNPSISFVLRRSITHITVGYEPAAEHKTAKTTLLFNGREEPEIKKRMDSYLESIGKYMPFLEHLRLKIETSNTFPHAAGIASSASGFGAIALALVDIENRLSGNTIPENTFSKASFLARLGSGSACRSVYGGFSLWGKVTQMKGSSDFYAVPLNDLIHKNFQHYRDSILLVSSASKPVSSSTGHQMMNGHPFLETRVNQAKKNILNLIDIIKSGDTGSFARLVENEALTLHAMMMSGNPGYILMKEGTIEVISRIRDFRKRTTIPLCFTLDAGANVHLLYPEETETMIRKFVDDELVYFCEENKVIHDEVGEGPVKIEPVNLSDNETAGRRKVSI